MRDGGGGGGSLATDGHELTRIMKTDFEQKHAEGTEKQPELPEVKDQPPLDMEFTCQWLSIADPPNHENPVCVSTPGMENSHHIASWSKKSQCFVFDGAPLNGVTFWCSLPASPEYMAKHPEKFEEATTRLIQKVES